MNLLLEKRYVQYVRILFMNKMGYKEQILADRIPRHIAIIMDGNGRWAKRQGLARISYIVGENCLKTIPKGINNRFQL